MKVGIIGAGFTGLSAGYYLSKKGVDVTIFEKSDKPGGLAAGFETPNWQWPLEEHYHHIFESDTSVLDLAKEIGHGVKFNKPKTSVLIDGKSYQLDSPTSLLSFPRISPISRLRTGLVLAYLKLNPAWKMLEGTTSEKFLRSTMGEESWKVLWQTLFEAKFGKYSKEIPASWFWARIKKRSPRLGYLDRGFGSFAWSIADKISGAGGEIAFNSGIEDIAKDSGKFVGKFKNKRDIEFDRVVCTLTTFSFLKITKGLPKKYIEDLQMLKGIGAVTLIVELKEHLLTDSTYWLSVNDRSFPFLAAVEHTNFVDNANYGGNNIVYLGNYVGTSHKYFKMTKDEMLEEFKPYLKKLNKKFKDEWIVNAYITKSPFAQPIFPLNYSKHIPKLTTPIEGLYLANMQQVYPWDRGINYAVELGRKVADLIIK